jgi:hypothetical protein
MPPRSIAYFLHHNFFALIASLPIGIFMGGRVQLVGGVEHFILAGLIGASFYYFHRPLAKGWLRSNQKF